MARSRYWLRKGRGEARQERFRWLGLPLELQSMVLENLVPPHDKLGFVRTRRSHLAAYSTVCRDWQHFFEKIIFHRLVLNQNDAPRFAEFTLRHASLVRHLWLRVELPRYDCSECRGGDHMEVSKRSDAIFRSGLVALFGALSRLEARASLANGASHPGLTLEISSHSPSDSEHHFKDISFDGVDLADEDAHPAPDDLEHSWISGRRIGPVPRGSLLRLFGRPTNVHPWKRLPQIFSVRHLLIRRQTRRQIQGVMLQCMLEALPGLQTVRYEPWRRETRRTQKAQDGSLVQSFISFLTKNVRDLVLFEEFNEEFDSFWANESPWESELIRAPSMFLALALANLKNLRSLSASFAVEAENFFLALSSEVEDGNPWENLTCLSLTSQRLSSRADYDETEALLLRAAAAARQMPNLRTMELWYGRRGEAFLFRYNLVDRRAEISCAGTWTLKLQPWVVKAWAGVSGRELCVGPGEVFGAERVRSHGDAIHHLGLQLKVVHPRSLTQIRREQRL